MRRLAISAACLALIVAAGGAYVFISGKQSAQKVAAATQVRQNKAPAVTTTGTATMTASASAPVHQTAAANPATTSQAAPKLAAVAPLKPQTASSPTGKMAVAMTDGSAPAQTKLPSPDSARWASNMPASSDVQVKPGSAPAQSMAAYASANQKPASVAPDASQPKADDSETASIPDQQGVAKDIKPAMERAAQESAPRTIDTGGSRAFLTTATNLRARPENHSHVIGVVPARAAVQLFSCSQWCKVAYDGREGYIYKEFISRSGHAHMVAHAAHAATAKSQVASTDSSGKLIGGIVVDNGAAKAMTAQPATTTAAMAQQPTQPAAPQALPETMGHDRH